MLSITPSELEMKRLPDTPAESPRSIAEVEERYRDMGTQTTVDPETGDSKGGDKVGNITGFKLFAVLASVTLAAFLMLLDGSIIGVVRLAHVGSPLNRKLIVLR